MQNTRLLFRDQGIHFCLVHIPEMLKALLPQSVGPGYQTRPGIQFRRDEFAQPVLSQAELTGLNQLFALKKQVERLAGRWAVKNLVMQQAKLSPDDIEIHNDSSGAPVLPAFLDYAISISHAGDYALAAALPGKANALGIDMEVIRPVDIPALLHAGFSQKEQQTYAGADLETILKIWTIKEAMLKYRRTGLKASVKKIEWLDETLFENYAVIEDLFVKSYHRDNIIFSVVSGHPSGGGKRISGVV
ncbi:4'-phosphopantetheinyl transferase superfamily protein [uncultured Desulfobacter sp.]|uniref:4'-phosphopantetheinyl transferase family protein n=1 Tax=uncultured Desulfobacter sp. TaxID=240139 RepID=UPI002AAAEE4A|nr:4'-phosphopantetheinyl transferase superfamily protein [uncultured Desulfobacter sp.]